MLVVLLALFVICWLPLMGSILFSEYRDDTDSPVSVFILITHGLLYFCYFLFNEITILNLILILGREGHVTTFW